MSAKIVATLCGVLLAVGFAGGYYFGRQSETVIRVPLFKGLLPIRVEQANPAPTVPDEVYQVQEAPSVSTLPDCPVPSGWTANYVVAERYPLRITPKAASFTYFDPRTGSVMIDRFSIPRHAFRYDLSAGLGATYVNMRQLPTLPTLDLRAEVEFRRLAGFMEVSVPLTVPDPVFTRVGLRYRFAGN